jgi:hypothetical protein
LHPLYCHQQVLTPLKYQLIALSLQVVVVALVLLVLPLVQVVAVVLVVIESLLYFPSF